MIIRQTWKQEEPKNAKIDALTTQVKSLQDKLNNGQFMKKEGKGNIHIAPWRLTKTLGDKVERDDKTWHWCGQQHNEGKGMYVRHHPDDHTTWKERNRKKKDDDKTNEPASDNKKKPGSSDKLSLSDNLKAAMMTKFKCSTDDADKLWKDVVANSSN